MLARSPTVVGSRNASSRSLVLSFNISNPPSRRCFTNALESPSVPDWAGPRLVREIANVRAARGAQLGSWSRAFPRATPQRPPRNRVPSAVFGLVERRCLYFDDPTRIRNPCEAHCLEDRQGRLKAVAPRL